MSDDNKGSGLKLIARERNMPQGARGERIPLMAAVFAGRLVQSAYNTLVRVSGLTNGDRQAAARRRLMGAVASEGGVVGAYSRGGPLRCEGERGVGCGVVVADTVEVIVDGDELGDGRAAAPEGGGEGDGLVDGGSGV